MCNTTWTTTLHFENSQRQCFVVRPEAAMDCSRQTPINRRTKSSREYQCERYVLHKINYTDHVVKLT